MRKVNGSESMKRVSEGRAEPFITYRISFIVFKHYLYLVYVISIILLEWSLCHLPMIFLSIHEFYRKSKPITQFLFDEKGARGPGYKG